MLFCVDTFGQNDTIWNMSITARYASEIVPTTGKSFKMNNLEVKFQKRSNTFIPIIGQKSIHGIDGCQFGLAHYKKWRWGYSHTDFFYSSGLIFPKTVLRSNVYFKILGGPEMNIGVGTAAYADGKRLYLIRLGSTYYYRSIMASYSLRVPFSGYLSHNLSLRKYLNIERDYLQLNLSNGLDNEELRLGVNQTTNVYNIRVSIYKTVINKTQFQISFGVTKAIKESVSNEYFNYGIGFKRKV